jgi:hypothetical protein
MESSDKTQDTGRFNVIFVKLEEAKKEQDENFILELDASSETNKTISLFKEYQDSMVESSCTIFTKS